MIPNFANGINNRKYFILTINENSNSKIFLLSNVSINISIKLENVNTFSTYDINNYTDESVKITFFLDKFIIRIIFHNISKYA